MEISFTLKLLISHLTLGPVSLLLLKPSKMVSTSMWLMATTSTFAKTTRVLRAEMVICYTPLFWLPMKEKWKTIGTIITRAETKRGYMNFMVAMWGTKFVKFQFLPMAWMIDGCGSITLTVSTPPSQLTRDFFSSRWALALTDFFGKQYKTWKLCLKFVFLASVRVMIFCLRMARFLLFIRILRSALSAVRGQKPLSMLSKTALPLVLLLLLVALIIGF